MAVSCTESARGRLLEVLISWSGANQSGQVTLGGLAAHLAGRLIAMSTVPADTPDANYDIVLTDTDGVDVAGGALINRSQTAAERAYPEDGAGNVIPGGVPLLGPLTMTITNQTNALASGTVRLLFELYG